MADQSIVKEPIKHRFKKYSSIENYNNAREVQKIRNNSSTATDVWIATEKAHGAHMSFIVSDNGITAARRNGPLENSDIFNNFQSILATKESSCRQLFVIMRALDPEVQEIHIHGELIGGHYPNVPVIPGAKKVQAGVYYTNKNEFFAYDIYAGHRYLDYDVAIYLFSKTGFVCAPILHQGTFEEMLVLDNVFQSTIPELYGMPALEPGTNIAEGFVLRPLETRYLACGSRIMLKSKSPGFSEVIKKPKAPKNPADQAPGILMRADIQSVIDVLSTFVTVNRLNNVQSKQVNNIHKGRLMGLMSRDVLEEFEKSDAPELAVYLALPKEDQKFIKHHLNYLCTNLIQ